MPPIECHDDGSSTFTLVGTDAAIQAAVEGVRCADIRATIEQYAEYGSGAAQTVLRIDRPVLLHPRQSTGRPRGVSVSDGTLRIGDQYVWCFPFAVPTRQTYYRPLGRNRARGHD